MLRVTERTEYGVVKYGGGTADETAYIANNAVTTDIVTGKPLVSTSSFFNSENGNYWTFTESTQAWSKL